MIYFGIDNGVSGSIGTFVDGNCYAFHSMFVKNCWDYQEKGKKLNRIHFKELTAYLSGIKGDEPARALLEGPMLNPKLWAATYSATRAFEATLNVLEQLDIGIEFISVFKWRKFIMPSYKVRGTTNFPATPNAKVKSFLLDYAKRVYPEQANNIDGHGDPDGLLIAEYFYKTSEKIDPEKEKTEEKELSMF